MAQAKSKELTDLAIKSAKAGEYVTRMYDKGSRGLHLVIAPTGTKTFALRFTSPITGKRRAMTLGQYPDMSLADAHVEVQNIRKLIRQGIDPIDQNEQEEAEQVAEQALGTFEELFDFYIADMKRKKRKSWHSVQCTYNLYIKKAIGHMKAKDVQAQDIARKVLAPIFTNGKEVMANRTRSYMYSAFQLGLTAANSARYADAPNFGLQFNPVTLVPREGVESAGQRTLSKNEVKRLWTEIDSHMTKDLALGLKLILSSGQRVAEVLQAQWKEFDLDEKVWSLPAERRKTYWKGINNEPHIIPLTDLHIELLKELPRRSKYLFPDASGKSPIETDILQLAVKKYCIPPKKSDHEPFEYFTPRNLRRTFKTLAGEAGLSKEIRDRIQGHSQSDITSTHYDRYDYLEEKQKATQKWCNWLSRLVNRKKGTVVPIKEVG